MSHFSLNTDDKEQMKEVLLNLYGEQVNNWQINNQIIQVLSEVIEQSSVCSDRMDWVPRPVGTPPTALYIVKQFLMILKRKSSTDKKLYITCLNTAKYKLAGRMRNAVNGVL